MADNRKLTALEAQWLEDARKAELFDDPAEKARRQMEHMAASLRPAQDGGCRCNAHHTADHPCCGKHQH